MNEVINTGFSLMPSLAGLIGIGIVIVFLSMIFLAKAFRTVVEPNEVHIVQSRNHAFEKTFADANEMHQYELEQAGHPVLLIVSKKATDENGRTIL